MATKKGSGKTRAKSFSKQNRNDKRKVIFIFSGIVVLTIAVFVWFRNSSYWPWPSEPEIERRLSEIVDVCMFNEDSRGCQTLKSRYDMSFEYCYSLSEIPEIGKDLTTYGVAKLNSFKPSSVSYEKLKSEKESARKNNERNGVVSMPYAEGLPDDWDKEHGRGDSIFPYYGCVATIDEIGKSSSEDLLTSEPQTLALYDLSHIPKRVTSGDNITGCSSNWEIGFGKLWNEIPNIEAIKNEYNIAFDTYNKCSKLGELAAEQDRLNQQLYDYAHNSNVQQFYSSYDEWNKNLWQKGCYYQIPNDPSSRRDFEQECVGDDNKPIDFAEDMSQYMSTKFFTSKVMVE